MAVELEQVFFGRGAQGYAILGATPGGEPFRAVVEELCEAVGTPSSLSSFQPFLISQPCRDRVVMIKAGCGEPDSAGRSTVFFHALVGSAQALAAARVDAFTLDAQGLFTDRLPPHLERLAVAATEAAGPSPAPRVPVRYPAVIRSRTPEAERIRSFLGPDVLARAWATFAFRPLPRFDLYVLDVRVPTPAGVTCYDAAGTRLTDPLPSRPRPAEPVRAREPEKKEGGAVLKLSILLNVILLGLVAALFVCKPGADAKPAAVEEVRTAERAGEVERLAADNARLQAELQRRPAGVSRDEVLAQLRNQFMEKYKGRRLAENAVGEMVQPYVRFVNEAILKSSDGYGKE